MSKITDLKFDEKNFNKGTQYGKSLMDKSFSKFGAGRSILIDKHNNIIAGNKSTETFAEMGLNNVQIVDTDGKTLIAVRRNDIDLDTPEGREFAVADNQTAKTNIDFDFEMLESELEDNVIEEWGLTNKEKNEELYNTKIESPIYTPKKELKPKETDLYNLGNYNKLIDDINKSKISDKEKVFLKLAATRHIVFDYSEIAEFYAHSSEEAQSLMEDSALIIIDFKKAIELGFVKVYEELNELSNE